MKEDKLSYEIWKAVLHEVIEDEYAYKLTDKIISIFEKRIDELMTKYNPIESGYQTGYYNAICDFKELLK